MKAKPLGIYVHIPFCLKKCNYCDFCSFSDIDEKTREKYILTLIDEIKSYKSQRKLSVNTVFFGGGTPSLLSVSEFHSICEAIADSFDISDVKEFTLEANPKTVTKQKLEAFKNCGVNRVSIGLQSIHDNELKILGRIHNFEDFKAAYNVTLESGISNINVDVMYGIPEQTVDSFRMTLEALIQMKPAHISAYGLILEEKTKFWDIRDSLPLPDEDAECDMYELACGYLASYGYNHYEISNYALSDKSSRHNLKYWHNEEYIGFGVSAYSYFSGKRYGNSSKLSEYLSENSRQYVSEEILSPSDKKYEHAMLALRLKEGISLSEYEGLFGESFLPGREEKILRYIKAGYMTRTDDRIALTEKGFYISNTVLTDLL